MSCSGSCLVICFRTNSLVSLVHSVIDFLCYIADTTSRRDWQGALHCVALVAREAYVPGVPWNLPAWKRRRSSLRWLCHNDVTPTKLHKWHRVFGELGALPKIREEIVSELQLVFEFFRFMGLWALLVRCKTLIYCGQLCNNAVNYPSTPYYGRPSCRQDSPQNCHHMIKHLSCKHRPTVL
jgi:hypothetical protein